MPWYLDAKDSGKNAVVLQQRRISDTDSSDLDMLDIVMFGVNTGCRQGEIINLRWHQVDVKQRRLVLDNRGYMTKSKRVRSIPLNKTAIEVLQRRTENKTCDFIFTLEGAAVSPDKMNKRFRKHVKAAKLNPSLHFHSLRYSFASWLVQRGVSIYQVSKLLGHSSVNVTAIYSHLQPDDSRESVSKLMEPTN